MTADGWVKFWRQTMDSQVFQNSDLLKVWCWCLLRANHAEAWVPVSTGRGETQMHLEPGQFIFGRKTAAKALRMKPATVYSRMKKLEKAGNIIMQAVTHCSIITICNWARYQNVENKSEQPSEQASSRQVATNEQPSSTNKKKRERKEGKEEQQGLPSELDTPAFREAWAEWVQHLKEKKGKQSSGSRKKQLAKCEKMGELRALSAIDHSITMNYTGLFEKARKKGEPDDEDFDEQFRLVWKGKSLDDDPELKEIYYAHLAEDRAKESA